jgi:hypothetical protein
VSAFLGSGGGALLDVERQLSELSAYRSKIVALIKMLEGGVKVPGSEPSKATA